MIEVKLKSKTTRAADGMRSWLGYVRREVTAKIPGMRETGSQGSSTTYAMGEHTVRFTVVVSTDGLQVTMRVETLDKDGRPNSTPAIPAMVVIMVSLHLIAGRAKAGVMVPLEARIGEREFTEVKDVPEAYAALKHILGEKWYVPYAEGIDASDEYLKKPGRR